MLPTVLLCTLSAVAGLAVGLALWMRTRETLARDVARLEAERDAAVRALDDQRLAMSQSSAEVRDVFAAVSRDALKENRADFLNNADALFAPVRDTLERVRLQLADVDKAREGSFQAVSAQLTSVTQAQEQLRAATEGLSRSLRSPNVRGKWGEVQLRRIVELAGMLAHCDFVEKPTTSTSDGARQTPDLIVKLPGDATLVIDAKVPIDAYLAASNATTDHERHDLLARHGRQLRDHVRALGAKEYWRQFPSAPEFVVMFLPLEPLLSTAFEHDGALLEQAAGLRVIPATPMTLLALLKAVAYGWQQQAVTKNAEEIHLLGRELYERLATMAGHLEKVGTNIKLAADGYDKFVGSLEQSVFPSARRFKDLGVSATKTLETPDQLNLQLRKPRREVLPDGEEESAVVQAEARFRP